VNFSPQRRADQGQHFDETSFKAEVAAIIERLKAAQRRARPLRKTDEQFDADEYAFENGERSL
jgi:hypothetical protein